METQTLVKEICPTTTQVWVKRGALLVDVRERAEVAELAYGVNNIVNIPLSEFEDRYMELPKDTELVIVCRDGSKSLRAAGFLVNRGYNVVNMKHGIIRWVQKGFPTIGNTSVVESLNENSSCCGTSDKKSNSSCCNSHSTESSNCC